MRPFLISLLVACALSPGARAEPAAPAPVDVPAPVIAPAISDAQALLEQADRALGAGRLDEAQSLLSQLPNPGPDGAHDMAALLQAELAIARAKPDIAAAALASITSDDFAPCRIAVARGGLAINAGQFAAAVAQLSAATTACPDNAMLWRWRARAERGAGQSADALLSLRAADARAPDTPAILNDLAVALMDNGDTAAAIAVLDSALARAPGDAALARNRVYAEGMAGRAPARRVGEQPQDWSDRLVAAGDGAVKAGNAKLAKALYAEAMIQNPNYSDDLVRRYRAVESFK